MSKKNGVLKPQNSQIPNNPSSTTKNGKCCVKGCKSLHEKPEHLMFHNFPGEEESVKMITKTGETVTCSQLKLWLCVLEIRANQFKPWLKVCSRHFTEDCYELSDQRPEKKLKSTAVPSRNLPGMEFEIRECSDSSKSLDSYNPDVTYMDHAYCLSTEREDEIYDFNLFRCSNDLDVYKCKQCDFRTKLLVVQKAHFSTVHQLKRRMFKLEVYVCRYCKFRSNSQFVYTRHLAQHDRKLYCRVCKFSSLHLSDLRVHVKEHGAMKKGLLKQITWHKCTKCFHASPYQSALNMHVLRLHSPNSVCRWFRCKKCPFRSRWIEHLQKHTSKPHVYSRLRCDRCHQISNGVVWKKMGTIMWWACRRCCYKMEIVKY